MKKFQATANPELAKAMRDIRRSGASGVHADRRAKRARTRSAALRKVLAAEA